MRPLIFLACLALATPAMARAPDCADTACLRDRLQSAMRHLLGTAPDPARQAELMTTQVLWQAYRDMQCGDDFSCLQRQTGWRLQEIAAASR